MTADVETFLARWQGREGGQERANYVTFLVELCDVIGVPRPEPASANTAENDYVFERSVKKHAPDGSPGAGRIDLYRRNCFVLEAKQSRQPGGTKALGGPDLFGHEPARRGVRTAGRTWDVLMLNARRQAEDYARALPVDHGWPPFILVCDVGHVIETYADFSGQGKNYAQFPDRQSFRIYLDDLRDPEIRARLAHIWTDPLHLDPARHAARATREIAERLADVSKALEDQGHDPEQVAMFLMRCLFTMFACSPGVELLPKDSFSDLLRRCEQDPSRFVHMVGQLWEAMDKGDFAYALETKVRRFNGEFFKTRTVLPLGREEIGELRQAALKDWKDVDPSIFGTLLEQALDKTERRRLGAHYTPRAYVERLVVATVIEPLRHDWEQALSVAERQKSEGRQQHAEATIRSFHTVLCNTRILDPACGTGNFLYVSLELLKRLEGEVLEALAGLGGQEALTGLARHTVDPHQFLGLELNPRAAAIAELVLWIGFLQWHFRTRGGVPAEPILQAFHNIQGHFDAVLEADETLQRDASGKPVVSRDATGTEREVNRYTNPRQPVWPPAEFIVGNPPFIGGKFLRSRLGDTYVKALWASHKEMNDSADFVMYWWDHAANLLSAKHSNLRCFGFVTTNSITQHFQSQVIKRHLGKKSPMSITMAIPDHPWTKESPDSAAVRIAMTVCRSGKEEGILRKVVSERGINSDAPFIELTESRGAINSNLTIGIDTTSALSLRANDGVCSPGVKLHGAGFIITKQTAEFLGLGKRAGLEKHILEYRNGRDLTNRPRGVMVIDLHGLQIDSVRDRFPEIYQYIKAEIKEKIVVGESGEKLFVGRDWNNRQSYRDLWWLFGEPREEIRPALRGLPRYIGTPVTQKHRTFEFMAGDILPDDAVMIFALADAYVLGILHSRSFRVWFEANASTLEDRPRFIKSRCFDPFPFPNANDLQKHRIRTIAEDLDAHRKHVLAEHPHLTLTGLYNVLEELRAGTAPNALSTASRRIFDDGLVLILQEYHDRLDAEVTSAYGWPAGLPDTAILAHLVALNQDRAREEASGHVRWLRPDYQIPRFGSAKDKLDLIGGTMHEPASTPAVGPKPAFPAKELDQAAAVMAMLNAAGEPLSPAGMAARFRQGRRVLPQIEAALAAMHRVGGLVATSDAGKSFVARRAA